MTVREGDPQEGFFTFIHHDWPIEWSGNIAERLEFIASNKPKHERATRNRCIVYVPEALLPAPFIEAERVYSEARRVHFDQLLSIALALVPDAPWSQMETCLVFAR